MLKEKIVNIETGEETWRDYTAAEIAEVELAQAQAAQRQAEAVAKETARQAVLTKLGLTPEEAQTLFA